MLIIKDGREFRVERELLDATPAVIPDLGWRHIDSHGHIHIWYEGDKPAESYRPDRAYHVPSVRERVLGHYWCPDCNEEHAEVCMVCVLCGERVDRGYSANEQRYFIAGLASYYVDGNLVRKEQFLEALNAANN